MVDTLGKRIRDVRLRYGMSQAELARRIGITPQAMNAIENESVDPRASRVAAIARILRVSSDYLLGLRDDEDVSAFKEVIGIPMPCPEEVSAVAGSTPPPVTTLVAEND